MSLGLWTGRRTRLDGSPSAGHPRCPPLFVSSGGSNTVLTRGRRPRLLLGRGPRRRQRVGTVTLTLGEVRRKERSDVDGTHESCVRLGQTEEWTPGPRAVFRWDRTGAEVEGRIRNDQNNESFLALLLLWFLQFALHFRRSRRQGPETFLPGRVGR